MVGRIFGGSVAGDRDLAFKLVDQLGGYDARGLHALGHVLGDHLKIVCRKIVCEYKVAGDEAIDGLGIGGARLLHVDRQIRMNIRNRDGDLACRLRPISVRDLDGAVGKHQTRCRGAALGGVSAVGIAQGHDHLGIRCPLDLLDRPRGEPADKGDVIGRHLGRERG